MWVPSTSSGLNIDWRWALMVLSLGVLLVVWLFARPPFFVMLLLALVLPAVLVVAAVAVGKQRPVFEREFSRHLQRSEPAELHRLIKGAWALRWFGPAGFMDEKRGLVASLEGNWELADRYLERAYVRVDFSAQKTLLPAILRAKYEAGLRDEAEQIAGQLLGKTRYPGTPELFLGLILAERDDAQAKEDAKRLLKRAAETLGGSDKARAEQALASLGS